MTSGNQFSPMLFVAKGQKIVPWRVSTAQYSVLTSVVAGNE
jgi:hypothetical protein